MTGLLSKPKMPTVEPPTPLPDEEQTTKARRRRLSKETQSGGVRSTLLTAGGRETLGG